MFKCWCFKTCHWGKIKPRPHRGNTKLVSYSACFCLSPWVVCYCGKSKPALMSAAQRHVTLLTKWGDTPFLCSLKIKGFQLSCTGGAAQQRPTKTEPSHKRPYFLQHVPIKKAEHSKCFASRSWCGSRLNVWIIQDTVKAPDPHLYDINLLACLF